MSGAELRERLLGPERSSALLAWVGPLLMALVGGALRFWNLGWPNTLVFDETYYVKQATSLLEHGVELRVDASLEDADASFAAGTTDIWGTTGDMVVHGSVGKWVIAAGQWALGSDDPTGWRLGVTILGIASIVLVGRTAWRLFGTGEMATLASFLLAFEGHHFVHSRTGLLDLTLMFFALLAFHALLIDRERARQRLLAWALARGDGPGSRSGNTEEGAPSGEDGPGRSRAHTRLGPWLGWRPWRWAAGVSLGLAVGTKWSGLFFLAVFGLLTVAWDADARRIVGARFGTAAAVVKDGPGAFLTMVGTTLVVYVATFAGWFASSVGFDRQWGAEHPSSSWVPNALRSLWHYHQQMYAFHIGLDDDHPYRAQAWQWMVQARPTSFYYESPTHGQFGCQVETCSSAVTSLGTVSIWWLGTAAVPVLLWWWVRHRDWRAGAVLSGIVAGYLPWFAYPDRTTYSFYAVAFVPWVVLACVFVLHLALGPPQAPARRRWRGRVLVASFLVATVALFAFFWPVWTAQIIPYDAWRDRMWFPGWI